MVAMPAITRPARRQAEIGATGTPIFSGRIILEDYNPDLSGANRWRIYDRMRTSDGTIAGALRQLKLPLLRATWTVTPADNTPVQERIAKFVEDDLFNMTVSWIDYLRHALKMLDFGVAPFETVWELRPDMLIHLRKLAWRHPNTIVDWLADNNGGPAGVTQLIIGDNSGVVTIPIENMLVFSHEYEGSDFRGTSILRAAYKHWWYAQGMESVDAVAKEKRAMGVDVMELESTASDSDQDKAESALMTVRTHQRNFMTYRKDLMTYRIEGIGQGSVLSTMESMEYHSLRVLRALSAEILALAGGAVGSFALHKDKSALLLMLIEGFGEIIKVTHNKYLIPKMVKYNFGEQEAYPKLEYSKLDVRELGAFADALAKVVGAQTLTLDRGIEDDVREMFGFSELAPDEESITEHQPLPDEIPTAIPSGRPPLPDSVAAQRNRLLELADHLFTKGDKQAILDVSIPYKRQIAAALNKGDAVAAQVASANMGTRVYEAFTRTLLTQLDFGEFDRKALNDAIYRAQRTT